MAADWRPDTAWRLSDGRTGHRKKYIHFPKYDAIDKLKFLESKGINVARKYGNGHSLIHDVARLGTHQTLKFVLGKYGGRDKPGYNGWTPLMYCIQDKGYIKSRNLHTFHISWAFLENLPFPTSRKLYRRTAILERVFYIRGRM